MHWQRTFCVISPFYESEATTFILLVLVHELTGQHDFMASVGGGGSAFEN